MIKIIENLICLFFVLVGIHTSIYANLKQDDKEKPGIAKPQRTAFDTIRVADFDSCLANSVYEFRNIDFGRNNNITDFYAKVRTSYMPSGWIEFRLDSINGKQIGMCLISQRHGNKDWYISQTGMYNIEGIHSVYLKFLGAKFNGFNPEIEWFTFSRNSFLIPIVGKTALPPQVPYLGPFEDNFLGNGIAAAGGNKDGVWNYLLGPVYSATSFIDEEKLLLCIDDKEIVIGKNIKRARGTGVFYSTMQISGITVTLIDYSLQNSNSVTRAIFVKNESSLSHKISVKALIEPTPFRQIEWSTAYPTKVKIVKGTEIQLTQEDQSTITIANTDKLSVADTLNSNCVIQTSELIVKPKESFNTAFYHYAHKAGETEVDCIEKIRNLNFISEIETCIKNWETWNKAGISLEKVQDLRVRDILESNAIITKMLQGEDGGLFDTPRTYSQSYIRGAHNGMRGMGALGHNEEVKNYLFWVQKKYNFLKPNNLFPIPNAAGIGNDGYFPGFGNDENWSSETPALFMLIADNYYKKTGDIETLKKIDVQLRFAMKCQLDVAEKYDWKLPFNLDETESGGSGIRLWDKPAKWSMTSLLFLDASLGFYMTYLEKIGETDQLNSYREKQEKIRNSLYANFWNSKTGIFDWYRGLNGERPKCPISNYILMPLYFHCQGDNSKLAIQSALYAKQFVNERGFLPLQLGVPYHDFCGHNLGYLLYDLAEINDPEKDKIFDSLIHGGSVGCWGMWAEAYTGDGVFYGTNGGMKTWDNRIHTMRPMESGINVDAILRYLNLNKW